MTIDKLLALPAPQVIIMNKGGFCGGILKGVEESLYNQIAKSAGVDAGELRERVALTINIVPGSDTASISLGMYVSGTVKCDEDMVDALKELMKQ